MADRLADIPREIWFRRTFLWGSTAVHWKGAVALLVGVGLFLASTIIGVHFAHIYPALSGGCFIIAFAAIIGMSVIIERHMGPKYPDESSWPLSK